MNEGTALTIFFNQIWRLYQLDSPFFGLKIWQITLGLFVCELGIGVFSEFFVSLFNTSAPGAQEQFKERYHNQVWRERYKRFYK